MPCSEPLLLASCGTPAQPGPNTSVVLVMPSAFGALVLVGVLAVVVLVLAWSIPLQAVRPAIAIAKTPARVFRTSDHSLNVLDLSAEHSEWIRFWF
jgi:hypothetical protein